MARSKTSPPPETDAPPLGGTLPEEQRVARALGGPDPERSARRETAVAVRIDRLPDLPVELDVVMLRHRVENPHHGPALRATLRTISTAEFKAVAAGGGLFALCEREFGVGRYRATWIAKDLHEVAREVFDVPDLEAAKDARLRLWESQLTEIDDAADAAKKGRKDQRRATAFADAFLAAVTEASATLLPEQLDELGDRVAAWLLKQPKVLHRQPPAAVLAALARRYGPSLGLCPWSPHQPRRRYP